MPAGTLSGRAIALSVSDTEGLGALGLLQTRLQLALAEIARVVYVCDGGRLCGRRPVALRPYRIAAAGIDAE